MFTLKVSNLGQIGGALFLALAVAVGCLSLASAPQSAAQQAKNSKVDEEMATLLKARAALAQKTFNTVAEAFGETKRRGGGEIIMLVQPEEVYNWSVRWLRAERDLNPKGAEHVSALEGHLKRMKELETKVKALAPGVLSVVQGREAEWNRMEAELWLAQAKVKK
jgi:hypothetical protein